MNIKRTIFFIEIILVSSVMSAQERELRTLLLEQLKINSVLTTAIDGGYYKGFNGEDYTRWGIRNTTSYKLSNAILVDAGFMYNRTATPDNVVKNEFRPHQTLTVAYPRSSEMTVTHRFRMEEQFYTYDSKESNIESRFRYEIKTKGAFNLKKGIESKSPYWMASVEFFFNPAGKIQDEHILFNRGRHGIGIGYKLNAKTTVEGALLYQHTHDNNNYNDRSDVAIFNFYIKNSLFSKNR